ncbi:MAG TPA: BTAD domain-containing putative transcriptional regulator [Azospirillaceae bacterium]|nr:BTAD domain-containing putative transcriptional regulator [Azospirillaceae bacterium]
MGADITLLGGFSVRGPDGAPLALPTRKAEALLALLALRPGSALTRDRVAGLLWPASAEPQARGSLRQTLAQLRRCLPDGAVEAVGDSLRLDPALATSDTARLEAALAANEPQGPAAVAGLYAGRLLADFPVGEDPFEEWRRLEGERLHALALDAMGRRLADLAARGEAEEGVALGERLLALDPASEETHRALMRLHLARGARPAALRQYERCRDALRGALGVAPSRETEELAREARRAVNAGVAAEPQGPPGVAVLPFANLSGDPEQEYLALGIAEDVIRELSRFRSLAVLSRQAAFGLRDTALSPQEIGARLGCRFLLTGSVRRGAGTVRIGCELTDTATGYHLWAERFDAPCDGLPQLQDEIVRRVVGALAVRIDDQLLRQARCRSAGQLQAYDLWLRGLDGLRRATPEGLAEAQSLFHRATELDPNDARAWSGLSLSHFNDWSCLAWERWDECEARAFDYARRALELDDNDPVAQFIVGRILLYRREFGPAERHLERAEALNPNDTHILSNLALCHAYLGRAERAAAMAREAMRLNPFHEAWYCAFAAMPHMLAGELEAGVELGLKAPDASVDMRAYLACAHAHLGDRAEAARQAEAYLETYRGNIVKGRPAEPEEAVRWMFMVNPFRRAADTAFIAEGLRGAGLPVSEEAMAAVPPRGRVAAAWGG